MESHEYQRMATAEEQHWWYLGLHDLVLRWVHREAARSTQSLEILDAGCGTGRLCQLLQPFGRVSGCDIHPQAIATTKGRGLNHIFQHNLVMDRLGPDLYDLITCMDVLYHRTITDDVVVLQSLYRTLRHGGLLLLHVPAFECLRGAHDVAVHTGRRYRKDDLLNLLIQAHFTIEFSSYRLPLLFGPILLWRQFSRLYQSAEHHADTAIRCPAWLNTLLIHGVLLENQWLAAGKRFPFGLSLFVCARRVEWRRRTNPLSTTHRPSKEAEQPNFLKQYHHFIQPTSGYGQVGG